MRMCCCVQILAQRSAAPHSPIRTHTSRTPSLTSSVRAWAWFRCCDAPTGVYILQSAQAAAHTPTTPDKLEALARAFHATGKTPSSSSSTFSPAAVPCSENGSPAPPRGSASSGGGGGGSASSGGGGGAVGGARLVACGLKRWQLREGKAPASSRTRTSVSTSASRGEYADVADGRERPAKKRNMGCD